MIDIEKINEKYLIALQALQDIMGEIEEYVVPEEFKNYLRQIHTENSFSQLSYFLRELEKFPMQKEPEDIFITSFIKDKQTLIEDLWLFFEGFCIRVEDFTESNEPERMELIALKGPVQKK